MEYNEELQLFALGTKIAFQCHASSIYEQLLRGYIYNAFKKQGEWYIDIAAEYLGREKKYYAGGAALRPYESRLFRPIDLSRFVNYQYRLTDLLLLDPVVIGTLNDDFAVEELILNPNPIAHLLASINKRTTDVSR